MINLLPEHARRQVTREYYLRVVAVFALLLGTAALVVAALLLPTFVELRSERIALESRVNDKAAAVATYDTGATALTNAMRLTALLEADTRTAAFTNYVTSLTTLANTTVVLRSFDMKQVGTTTEITIAGTAATRQSLASFRDAINASAEFDNAVLPISSLIKDRDLDFILTVTGITPTTP